MDTKTEGTLAIIAALLVLFSAMVAPPISAGLAVVFLLAAAGYKLFKKV